jgi:hypothetical protein
MNKAEIYLEGSDFRPVQTKKVLEMPSQWKKKTIYGGACQPSQLLSEVMVDLSPGWPVQNVRSYPKNNQSKKEMEDGSSSISPA